MRNWMFSSDNIIIYPGYFRDSVDKIAVLLGPEERPGLIVEVDPRRRQKFLECPPTLEPAAFPQRIRFPGPEILEDGVAHLGVLVPLEHGVDGFRQLGAAGLVDTAGVDPSMSEILLLGKATGVFDFAVSFPSGEGGGAG